MNKKWFYPLLIGTTIASSFFHFFSDSKSLQFATACLSLLFWAALLGKATENVAHYSGERLGGLLNATFGNAAELIIAIFLVKEGLFDMVKASITGSVIGNLLLVLGLSAFFGGLKFKMQSFNPILAGHNASLMMLSVIGLFVPAVFLSGLGAEKMNTVSVIIASVLIVGYFLWLFFSLFTHKEELGESIDGLPGNDDESEKEEEEAPDWSKSVSLILLVVSTAFVALQSEWLVHSVEAVAHALGWSELFVGAFLIAIIGNAAEHSAAIFLAMKNRIGAAVEIAVGSSLQIALFVAPVLVFISFLFGNPMNIIFSNYEIAAIAVSAFIAASISRDGSTNWYEGVLLLMVYAILGTVFFVV
ncbi:calcium/proton exchanger [Paenactinomyces guangxiensis]|uniref:Ca(2+)/H(+) antiporter n=1 Tax=Paenactinomyces guangxiensis TaxID=1490290 RepID=A0A7W2A607_9BACL|nr:calcium/proton exchanger [Paenactinomyces guangxiensis]MBA4492886.1 calcium/proton exchanger [Paenactinomyces guangxiensis]MBH8590266.1 calcium/proton exchanger [Paenactinomyces guangxiensis]